MQARPTPIIAAIVLAIFLGAPLSAQVSEQTTAAELVAQARKSFEELRFADVLKLLDEAIAKAGEGTDSLPIAAEAHELKSAAFEQMRDLPKARDEAEIALRLHERALEGEARVTLIGPLLLAARLGAAAQDPKAALTHYARALEIAAKERSEDANLELAILHPMAKLQRQIRDLDGAITSYERYIATMSRLHGKLHADLSQPLWDLAQTLRSKREFERAAKAYAHWIAVYEEAKGEGDPSIARGVAAITDCRIALGELDAAEKEALRWRALLEKVSNAHPEQVLVHRRIAKIENLRGRRAEEIAALEAAIRCGRALSYPDNVRDADSLRLLATAQRAAGKLDEAKAAIEQALPLLEGHLGPNDPQRQLIVLERAQVLEARKENAAAAKDYESVLRAFETIAGKKHATLAEPLRGLIRLANAEGATERALELEKRLASLEGSEER